MLDTLTAYLSPHIRRLPGRLNRLAGAARRHPLPAILWATTLVSAVFLLWPGLDLLVSGLYWDPVQGFSAREHPWLMRLRGLGPFLVWTIALASAAVILLKLLAPGNRPLVPLRVPLFLLSSLALGPGLLVNGILKQFSGRPRPHMVDHFGGDLPYMPVWRFSDLCASNCSFVSGEGASGAWLMALALIVPAAWRRPALYIAVTIGAALSLNRIAFGGHFLSDTLLAWCLVLLLIDLLYRALYVAPPVWLREPALDATLTRLGDALHSFADRLRFRLRDLWQDRRR